MKLQELPIAFKQERNEKIAQWIVKYQKFSTPAALNHISVELGKNTLKQYFDGGVSYLNGSTKNKILNFLYPYIDKCVKDFTTPLTPSLAEKRRNFKKATDKDAILPIQKLEFIKKPLTAKFIYGVRFDDFIKIFDSEEEAKGFNKGIEYAKGTSGKLVTVEINDA